jgi:2-oxoglutarate ferredoxin oxidoreductase subunit alpha
MNVVENPPPADRTNDFVVKFANVNGSGSASANGMFAKALFRMGIPTSPRNIFPSNIQGLPTWFEIRVSEAGHLGRRDGIDLFVAMNAETYARDVAEVVPGGFLLYDSTRPKPPEFDRDDVHYLGIPISRLIQPVYADPKQRQLFKNIVYVGALSALLDMDFEVLTDMLADQFRGKEKLIGPNVQALEIGRQYALEEFDCPLDVRVRRADAVGDRIMVDGNTACALGFIWGGATVAAWYPITPSTSVAEAFEKHAAKLRRDEDSGRNRFAIMQAEDELAAIGMVIGAGWNGARAFTATSGPGVSLMQEFLGLAYFAEIPAVVVDVQRAGPSTGMPTRTQQSDLLSAAYASHGDTKHVMLLPSTPKECFDFSALSLDLAERLQTPILVMTDLDLGMNDHLSEPFEWEEGRGFDRGKVLDAEALDAAADWGRYLDVDGDGIGVRTLPGAHPDKGAFFTRGTSRDEYAKYTEDGAVYVRNMERLQRKWQTAAGLVPPAEIFEGPRPRPYGLVYYGTTAEAMGEAVAQLRRRGIEADTMRLRGFPFGEEVVAFLDRHETVFVVEQNRDGQMRQLLIAELERDPAGLVPILDYDGMPMAAARVADAIDAWFDVGSTPRISEVTP